MTRKGAKPATETPADRDTVLEHMAKTGCTPTEAARHFFPGASPETHKKLANKYKTWAYRLRKKAAATSPTSGVFEPTGMPAVDPDFADLTTVQRLESMLGMLEAAVRHTHAVGDVRGMTAATKEVRDTGKALDIARAAEANSVSLDIGADEIARQLEQSDSLLRRIRQSRAASDAAKERDL